MGEIAVLIREPDEEPRRVPLREGATSIGRVKQNELVVEGANVSRQHCKLTRAGDDVVLENLSKNGTRVNGKRVEGKTTLAFGDRITLGEVELVLLAPEDDGSKVLATPSSAVVTREELQATAGDDDDDDDDDDEEEEEEEEEDERKKKKLNDSAAKRAAKVVIPTPDPDVRAARVPEPSDEKRPEPSDEQPRSDEGRVIPTPDPDAPRKKDSARAPKVEAPSDEGSRDVPATPLVRRPPRHAPRQATSSVVGLVVSFFILGFIVSVLGSIVLDRLGRSGETRGASLPPQSPETGTTTASVPEEPKAVVTDDPGAAWSALANVPPDRLAGALDDFARRFPDDGRAFDATWLASRLRARPAADHAAPLVARLVERADRLAADHELARARDVLDLVAHVSSASDAQARLADLSARARDELAALRSRAKDAAERDGAVRGLVVVLEGRERLKNLGIDDELALLTQEHEEAAAKAQAESPRRRGKESSGANLREPLDLTLKLDFDAARAKWAALLMGPLTVDERLRVEWTRGWCDALALLFDDVLRAVAADKRPPITVRGALRGVVVKADAKTLVIEATEGGGSASLEWPWKRLEPAQVLELLEPLAGKDELRNTALAFFALSTGHEDRGHGYLIDIIRRRADATPRVSSFLAIQTDATVPEGGYVVFEGRLIPPSEKDRILAERKKAKEEAAAAAQELARNREKPKLLRYLKRALELCDEGYYVDGRAILEKLAKHGADTPGVGDVARARLAAPYLRRRALETNGSSANRLDFYVLGDGYVLDDDKQRAFDRCADGVKRFVEQQDFYKEYSRCFNWWAVNLASRDEGESKDGQQKDTPLGGQINGGVFTLDRGKTLGVLEAAFPGENDAIAFGVGNADAQVATGGGGVAAIPRSFLQSAPHEMGHALAGLGDEYEQDPKPGAKLEGNERPQGHVPARAVAPNVVEGSDENEVREAAPWRHWFPIGDPEKNWTTRPIGAFEGASQHKFNFWRPQRACVMRDVGSPFCAACMEQMVLQLYRRVRPIDRTWPEERTIHHPRGKDLVLRISLLAPRTHILETSWRIEPKLEESRPSDGGTVAGVGAGEKKKLKPKRAEDVTTDVEGVKIPAKMFDDGSKVVVVEAWDPTPWVRKDDEGLLRQTVRWTIEVE